MTRIKFCGIRCSSDTVKLNKSPVDYFGMVFVTSSRRAVDRDTAVNISCNVEGIPSVGVFRNQPISYILYVLETGALNMIQLHGDEDEGYIREVKERTGLPVIKAFKVTTKDEA